MQQPLSRTTLASALWPTGAARPDMPAPGMAIVRAAILVVAGAGLLWISAKVKVPMIPVPMTMQTFVVLTLGAMLGARLGAATVALYLAQGALGLPVFADTPERGLGLAYMTGPTGGYLLGFLVAAALMGWLAERGLGRSVPRLLAAMMLGHAVIFAFGWAWLAGYVGPIKAWTLGVEPFALATLVKSALGAALVPAVWGLVRAERKAG